MMLTLEASRYFSATGAYDDNVDIPGRQHATITASSQIFLISVLRAANYFDI